MKQLIILGAGGHGKVCANIAYDMEKWDDIVFIDDSYPKKKKCLHFDIIGKISEVIELDDTSDYFVAIGNNEVREKMITELKKQNKTIATLIHPSSYVGLDCIVGEGTSIHQNAVVNTETTIGVGTIINTGVIVEHENKIGSFVHLSPNVSLGGQVSIGNRTWVGIGATIINNINIRENVMVGAKSLVLKDIESKSKGYGIPIKLKE